MLNKVKHLDVYSRSYAPWSQWSQWDVSLRSTWQWALQRLLWKNWRRPACHRSINMS